MVSQGIVGARSREYQIGNASELSVCAEDVSRFYRQNWRRQIALGLPSFYRWQFCLPPVNAGQDRNCVAVAPTGEILAVMGLNERPFVMDGEERRAAELTTWVVSEDHKGRGIGRQMMNYLQASYEILLGTGISDEALPIYLGHGFSWIRFVPRYYRVLNLAAVRAISSVTPLGERLAEKWKSQAADRYVARACTPESLAPCFDSIQSQVNFFSRDARHLSWRYRDHPVYAYECYQVSAPGGQPCAVAMRFDEVSGVRLAHVVDCAGPWSSLPAATAFIDSLCRDRQADAVDFWCMNARLGAHFRTSGWFSAVDSPYFELPSLFYPIEVRSPPTTSLAIWAQSRLSELTDCATLYVTKSDLDLDRPTLDFYRQHKIAFDSGTY